MKKNLTLGLFFLFFFIIFAEIAIAQPPLIPFTVKGNVFVDDKPASVGTLITAKIGDDKVSEFNITNEGLYAIGIGVTPENQGETAKLYVNGIETEVEVVLKSGEVETVDLFVSTPLGNVWYYLVAVLVIVVIIVLVMVKRRK